MVGRDGVVGIATRYMLDVPEIESRWGWNLRTRPDRPWDLPRLLSNGHRVIPGGKAAEPWRWSPAPSSAQVKEREGLYLYSTSGPSWPVLGWKLLLPLPLKFPNLLERDLLMLQDKLNTEHVCWGGDTLSCIRKVLSSNLCRSTDCCDSFHCVSFLGISTNTTASFHVFLLCLLLITLLFDAICTDFLASWLF
jgi:hypothetical protein